MIDWTLMTPHDVAVALRTLPHQVLYAWREDSAGGWARESVIEYRHHVRSMVERTPEGSWLGPRYEDGKRIPNPPVYATAEEAKAAYDVFFLKRGYCLHATDDGSAVPWADTPQPAPGEPIDWSKLTTHELAVAIRTIPKAVAYAWSLDKRGTWVRNDCLENGVAWAAGIYPRGDGYTGPVCDPDNGKEDPIFATIEEAKAAYDRYLRAQNWLLDETEDGTAC